MLLNLGGFDNQEIILDKISGTNIICSCGINTKTQLI